MPEAMDGAVPSLSQLVGLLASAERPRVAFTGVLTQFAGDRVERRWRVWQLRDLARIEEPPSRLSLLAGNSTFWRSWPVDDGVKVIPRPTDGSERFDFDLAILSMQRTEEYWSGWLSQDPGLVRETLEAVVHQGRPAWRFTAPPVKGGASTLTVDAELGLVVRSERADVGCFQEWSELRAVPDLDESFFESENQ